MHSAARADSGGVTDPYANPEPVSHCAADTNCHPKPHPLSDGQPNAPG